MALKRTKQTSKVQTGLKREKSAKTLLDFFKDNNQNLDDVSGGVQEENSDDEMIKEGAQIENTVADEQQKTEMGSIETGKQRGMSDDDLLNATLKDYESLLMDAKKQGQIPQNAKGVEGQSLASEHGQGNVFSGLSTGVGVREGAAIVPATRQGDSKQFVPLSHENRHDLQVLAEIRELIKSASSNLHRPTIDYMTKYRGLEQRHRTGLGENRVNDAAIKPVIYNEEFPVQTSNVLPWPTEKTGSSLVHDRESSDKDEKSKSVSMLDKEEDSANDLDASPRPTKSSTVRSSKLKLFLTPSTRRKSKGKSNRKATVKNLGQNSGSILQTLMRKMESIRERVDEGASETSSYSGGVSLGAVFQGAPPLKGIPLHILSFLNHTFLK